MENLLFAHDHMVPKGSTCDEDAFTCCHNHFLPLHQMVSIICLSENKLQCGLRRAKKNICVYSLLTNLIAKIADIDLPFNPLSPSTNLCINLKTVSHTTDMRVRLSTYI